ncbi:polar amino acid ABC transporter, inner membrane subunit [Methylobacterium sp. 4-46]|uniref:amino acid ABC transporter permease n=1 Tax=unclassified Methylobacterium TaxID=2615210 RepID=UPI000165CE08|nr:MULTISPECIES: amino acid ABC transporter permease [Methylobacterium]ACA20158.1 polar amino acid ABC transporter, inner membrane subunit [Methylobacterium sp. 4-46]WFT79337.1 amino acid ABC transporter permease [Methylobacterium nodulans]
MPNTSPASGPPRVSPLNDPKVRGAAYQILLLLGIGLVAWMAISNAAENLRNARIASGFGFLGNTAGFDVSQALVPFAAATSTYGAAFVVGLLNTLLVAVIGIAVATVLGFLIGVARLSPNWMLAKLATVYVEVVRNIPLLLQLLFWYVAVLAALPGARDSLAFPGSVFLNQRGLYVPKPILAADAWAIPAAFGIGVAAALAYRFRARREQARTGRQAPVGLVGLALVLGLPLLAWAGLALAGLSPVTVELPVKGTFNLRGGLQLFPEFVALVLGLSIYTAAFIAEVVRSGIQAVAKGQTEAARALGLRPGPTLRLVVIPQAMRVIVPPLTSQYLNLTKNSSLAVAIGYPDLVQVFMGTVLNQTGQAVEVVAITMAVYLTISLVTATGMNLYNRRVALIER